MEDPQCLELLEKKMAAPSESTRRSWSRLRYEEKSDTASDTRNVLLVVVALITAVTFQAGVNPPGGVWQESKDGHHAGRAIYSDQKQAFYVFLISNTLALSTSILVLGCLTYRFPFYFELWISIAAMFFTYASAVYAIAPDETVRFRYILGTATVPFGIRFVIQLLYKLTSKDDSPSSMG